MTCCACTETKKRNNLLTVVTFQKESLIWFLKTHPSLLIIGINAIVVLVVLILKCTVRRNSRNDIYSVSPPQQETSFINNANNNLDDRYYDYSLGVSSVEMDFHYYDEVPIYSEAEYCNVQRTYV